MTKPTFKRFLAYILDVIIVAIIATALSRISFLNPRMEEYDRLESEYTELLLEARKDPNKMAELVNDEKTNEITYDISYNSVYMNICTVVITGLYFIGFQYYTKGKTLGRKLFKIELISKDGSDVTLVQLLKRSIIINSLVTSTALIIMISTMNKEAYLQYSSYVQLIEFGLIFLSCGFVLYREDGVGLHDLFAGTRVILSSEREKYNKSLVKDANIVNEVDKTSQENYKKEEG